MNNSISIVATSHIGNSRENNEDNLLIPPHTIILPAVRDGMSHDNPMVVYQCECERQCLCVVSDGMGGQAAGELASLITVDFLSRHSDELVFSVVLGEEQIKSAIYALNQEVCKYAAADNARKGMGATLSSIIVNESNIVGVHIGDSRIYRFNQQKLEQLSKDHTEGQRLLDLELVSKDELKHLSYRKALNKHIGMDANIVVDVFSVDLVVPGTIIMLCTDGLTDALSDNVICDILSNDNDTLKDKALNLINCAVRQNAGYGDNTTLILMLF